MVEMEFELDEACPNCRHETTMFRYEKKRTALDEFIES